MSPDDQLDDQPDELRTQTHPVPAPRAARPPQMVRVRVTAMLEKNKLAHQLLQFRDKYPMLPPIYFWEAVQWMRAESDFRGVYSGKDRLRAVLPYNLRNEVRPQSALSAPSERPSAADRLAAHAPRLASGRLSGLLSDDLSGDLSGDLGSHLGSHLGSDLGSHLG